MKKGISLLLAVLLVLSLAACGANTDGNASDTKTVVRMATLKGPTGIGTAKLWADDDAGKAKNDYAVTLCTDPTEVLNGVVEGSYDVAAVPLNMASVLYNKLNGGVQILAINTLGTLYMLSTQDLADISALEGKTVVTAGQGATPEYVLNYLLEKNGLTDKVTVEFKSEHAEVATLAAAAGADDQTIYMLPEPNVTASLLQNQALKTVLDVSSAFESASGVSLAMGCIVAKKEFVEQNKDAVDAFLTEYKASVEYTETNLDDTATLCETYGIIPKAAVAKQAIPRCSITCVTGADMQKIATENLNVLLAASPKAIGGALPADDFWYGV
ncbi:MAG: ABC transporter substrate-binding protein [Clostridia bacterium]|nr:ABC transporter substrate-binding protein [Clostridia bacterium]